MLINVEGAHTAILPLKICRERSTRTSHRICVSHRVDAVLVCGSLDLVAERIYRVLFALYFTQQNYTYKTDLVCERERERDREVVRFSFRSNHSVLGVIFREKRLRPELAASEFRIVVFFLFGL